MDFLTELNYKKLLDACFNVHKALGPGLLESSYELCLAYELQKSGLQVATQVPMPITYEEIKFDAGYRIDLLVEDSIVVELKAVEEFHPVHLAQIMTYMKLSGNRLGLLVNFNVQLLKNGIKRVII
ncbi:GxxExxY protein [Algoriphagus limi]|uniref:GxxExxY protein n=1 Tax=Algoriphagus limi TaxID=2975273 RepID=A0ABT2G282_9BACT|nr:GxxExxY protein [Algoriphagus limi]MCS5489192.1 GxxExxY protein [Algoriphagus limi]